jgi:hypothetical protein
MAPSRLAVWVLVLATLFFTTPHLLHAQTPVDAETQLETLDPGDKDAVKMEGLARSMGMSELDTRIARLLYEVNTGKRSPEAFYEGLARAGGTMFDVIRVRSHLVNHADQSFARQIMGPTYSSNGTPVEEKLLTWRRQQTLGAIDEVVKQFVDAGRIPAHGFELIISHVGKWANQADRSLTFTGDIDFSFVSNDVELAQAMKDAFAQVIRRRTHLDPIALDSVATAHGKAGLEVYIGRHGMAYAEKEMKINEVVDMTTGSRVRIEGDDAAKRIAAILTIERQLADAAGVETVQPVRNTEPGLSMEMARHFQHDIVAPKIFDLANAVVKAAKYLDRSYTSLRNAHGVPSDPKLADFARQITELANKKPQTRDTRESMLRLISEHMGSPPQTVWDLGVNKLVLTIDADAVDSFHQHATEALWETVKQGSVSRTRDLENRLAELLVRQPQGQDVPESAVTLRQEMVDFIDMVEAELKAAHGMPIPPEVIANNVRTRELLATLNERFGFRKLSAEELKDKIFIEELLKAQARHPDPSRLRMLAGYIMERSARAAKLSMTGVEKTNQLLDFIDDGLLGPLRGDSDFAQFEAEMKRIRQADMDPRLRSEAVSRLSVLQTRVAEKVKNTNLYLNEKLQGTAAGRQGMKLMMIYGLVDEMQAYRDAFHDQGWGGFATEIFRRRIPFGGAAENYVMGNTLRAGWDVVTTLIPPLALPEAAYGLGTSIGTQVRSTYWNEQLAVFADSLYADAVFKLVDVQTYEGAKVGAYRLVRTFYNEMPLDLHRFAEMRSNQVQALAQEVEAGRVNWQEYRTHFNGLTEWLDVDASLKANLAASDPVLLLLEEMASHPAVGPKLMERLAEKGLARWEQVKLGFVVNLIRHLEERKQAEDALARGMLPDLYAELRKVAADLGIEEEVVKGLDAEVDTSNLKELVKWLWDAKRGVMGQAPTESETVRAAQAVKKYLDAYRTVLALRDQAASMLVGNAAHDATIQYLSTGLFLSGRADSDLTAASSWLAHIEDVRKSSAEALLAIKRSFLPRAGLESSDQPYLKRVFAHELWIRPYQDSGSRQSKKWMLDRAAGHVTGREKVLAEYKEWMTRLGPVQLTVTAVDSRDPGGSVTGLKIELIPTEGAGSPINAVASGNQVIVNVPMGRYRLSVSAAGYLESNLNVVYGRGLTATPVEMVALLPADNAPTPKDAPETQSESTLSDLTNITVTAPSIWPGPVNETGLHLKRQEAKGGATHEMCPYPAGVFGEVSGKMNPSFAPRTVDEISAKFEQDKLTNEKWGRTVEIRPFSIGDYQGLMLESTMRYLRGGWSGDGYRDSGVEAFGHAFVTKGGRTIELTYSVGSGGCWDNSQRAFQESQTAAARAEAQAILAGIRLSEQPALVQTPYNGPKLDGSDLPVVRLRPDKIPVLKVGESFTVEAVVENAKSEDSPFSYEWTGTHGNADDLKSAVATIMPDAAGKFSVTVAVGGARYHLGSAALEYTVADYKVHVERVPAGGPVAVGAKAGFAARLTVDGQPAQGDFIYRWQPHPEVSFDRLDAAEPDVRAVFHVPGRNGVWVQVLEKREGREITVAESAQLEIEVVAPKLSLAMEPAEPLVGQDVKARLAVEPEMKELDLRWVPLPFNAKQGPLSAGGRELSFYVKDDKPVALMVMARVPVSGESLGMAQGSVTARKYAVTVSGPKAMGPPPRVWKEGVGLVEVAGAIAVDQIVEFAADTQPAALSGPARYQWKVTGGTCSISNPISREARVTAGEAGTCELSVVVRDRNDVELGSAVASFTASVTREAVQQGKRKAIGQGDAAVQASGQGDAPAAPSPEPGSTPVLPAEQGGTAATPDSVQGAEAGASAAGSVLVGTWIVNANNYAGKIEFQQAGGRITASMWLDGHSVWEELQEVAFDGVNLTFTRPIPGLDQRYTGVMSGDEMRGTFDQAGSGSYPWWMKRNP